MLGQSKNSTAEEINIVRDLTARQRQREAEMMNEACRKNLERSEEELEQHLVYKVVGRKGEKREIKVPLRHGEDLDEDGRVTREMGWGMGPSRGGPSRIMVTGGNREPLGRDRIENVHTAQPKSAVKTTGPPGQQKTAEKNKKEERKETEEGGIKKVPDDWQPSSGKRGRPSPSPDKIFKRGRGGGVLELKNKFQKLAETVFGGEDSNLVM